eukprot:scaffold84976_cov60-Phaeocystis_antarctica.AAC.1
MAASGGVSLAPPSSSSSFRMRVSRRSASLEVRWLLRLTAAPASLSDASLPSSVARMSSRLAL